MTATMSNRFEETSFFFSCTSCRFICDFMRSNAPELCFVSVWCFAILFRTSPPSLWLTMRDVHITLSLKYPFAQRKAPADHSFPSASPSYLAPFPNQWPRSVNNELSSSSVFPGITSISDNSAAITPTTSKPFRKRRC